MTELATGAQGGIVLDEDQAASIVGDDTLDWLHATISPSYTWAVYLVGPDEVHTHVNPDLDIHDDESAEFTQRTALKFAADAVRNAAEPVHAVVLYHGRPWTLRDWDGPADAYCEWFDSEECDFFCNQCFRRLSGHNTPCPDHAPIDIPGLQVTDCSAEPGTHPRTFVYADNGGYGAPCMYCAYDSISKAHKGCEHSHHRAWRHWRITHRMVSRLHRLKLIVGSRASYNSECRGCISDISWRWSS